MRVEVIRQYRAWLDDPTDGLNATLAAIPRDAGDAAPPPVVVLDETHDDAIALGEIPVELVTCPLLVLNAVGDADTAETTEATAATEDTMRVLVRYVTPASYELDDGAGVVSVSYADALVHGLRTIRATAHVIRAAIKAARDTLTGPRAGVDIDEPPTVRDAQAVRDDESAVIIVATVFTQPAHDAWVRAGL